MKFDQFLKTSASKINQQLESYYVSWQNDAKRLHPRLIPLIEACISSNRGGKRLRGSLVDLGCQLAGQKSDKEIIKAAVAVEIIQTALLAHDDIIDKSPSRRGVPTMFMSLGGDHYGISQTICLGDVGFFNAFSILASLDLPVIHKSLAISSFSSNMIGTVLGEMLDVDMSMKNKVYEEKDTLLISYLKTATYTFIGPLQLGAILGGGDNELIKNLALFGKNLGIAFQIQDDILGVFGDEKTLGKSVTSDVEEGKNTTLVTRALEKVNKEQKVILDKYYGAGKITNKQMEEVRKVFIDTGALDYSRQLAVQYVSLAKKVIDQLTGNVGHKQLLNEMADFLIERQK